jgi:hypothetical protein
MSRTLKLVYTAAGLMKSKKYSSSGNPLCIRCNNRACTGESEKPRGNKSLSKSKFVKSKYKLTCEYEVYENA